MQTNKAGGYLPCSLQLGCKMIEGWQGLQITPQLPRKHQVGRRTESLGHFLNVERKERKLKKNDGFWHISLLSFCSAVLEWTKKLRINLRGRKLALSAWQYKPFTLFFFIAVVFHSMWNSLLLEVKVKTYYCDCINTVWYFKIMLLILKLSKNSCKVLFTPLRDDQLKSS